MTTLDRRGFGSLLLCTAAAVIVRPSFGLGATDDPPAPLRTVNVLDNDAAGQGVRERPAGRPHRARERDLLRCPSALAGWYGRRPDRGQGGHQARGNLDRHADLGRCAHRSPTACDSPATRWGCNSPRTTPRSCAAGSLALAAPGPRAKSACGSATTGSAADRSAARPTPTKSTSKSRAGPASCCRRAAASTATTCRARAAPAPARRPGISTSAKEVGKARTSIRRSQDFRIEYNRISESVRRRGIYTKRGGDGASSTTSTAGARALTGIRTGGRRLVFRQPLRQHRFRDHQRPGPRGPKGNWVRRAAVCALECEYVSVQRRPSTTPPTARMVVGNDATR